MTGKIGRGTKAKAKNQVKCLIIDAMLMGHDVYLSHGYNRWAMVSNGNVLFSWPIDKKPVSEIAHPLTVKKAIELIDQNWNNRRGHDR